MIRTSREPHWDRISELPDEVLSLILSRLTLKEVARMSILSKRWISALSHFSGSLVLETELIGSSSPRDSLDALVLRFISLVNRLLFNSSLCFSPNFQSLAILSSMDSESTSDLDNWLLFAFRKNVESLHVHLSRLPSCEYILNASKYGDDDIPKQYAFPLHLFNQYSAPTTFTSLRSLHLTRVEISEESLQWLLTHCPNLQSLSLKRILELVNLRISGPSLKLTHLELNFFMCYPLTDVEISAPNLVSLLITLPLKPSIRFSLENAPRLVEAGFMGLYGGPFIDYPTQFPFIKWTTLESLQLKVREARWNYELLQLNNLKYLELDIFSMRPPIDIWSSFLKGAPFVQYLTLEFMFAENEKPTREIEKVKEENPYKELKEVKIFRYRESVVVHEFIIYLVDNSPSLQKIVIDVLQRGLSDSTRKSRRYQDTREGALRFKSQLPAKLNCIVI